jgi:hypothetical protein
MLILKYWHLFSGTPSLLQIVDFIRCTMPGHISRPCAEFRADDRLGELVVPPTTVGTGSLVGVSMIEIT